MSLGNSTSIGSKNSKISNFNLNTTWRVDRYFINLLCKNYILEFYVSMNNLFGVTIVYCLSELQHNFKNFKFRELTLFESLPIVIKFPTRKIFHDYDESLLLSLSHCIDKLYDVFVLEVSKCFDFLFDHTICLVLILKIKVLYCNLLPSQLVEA